MWVRRNEQGEIVGMETKLPDKGDFIPTFPNLMKRKGAIKNDAVK
jgi:hypothetical protein